MVLASCIFAHNCNGIYIIETIRNDFVAEIWAAILIGQRQCTSIDSTYNTTFAGHQHRNVRVWRIFEFTFFVGRCTSWYMHTAIGIRCFAIFDAHIHIHRSHYVIICSVVGKTISNFRAKNHVLDSFQTMNDHSDINTIVAWWLTSIRWWDPFRISSAHLAFSCVGHCDVFKAD